jgi:cation-transporting ATPase E
MQPEPKTSQLQGLSSAEVHQRVELGRVNTQPKEASRSLSAIIRANTLTLFNAILGALLVLILAVGEIKDSLFGLVLISNMMIGILQELRAKLTLDRLSLLTVPRSRVIRDGRSSEIAIEDVVLDDVIELSRGDQVVADGTVIESSGLEIDESLLTGEAEPESKIAGDKVLSGSIAVAGSGVYRATAVGPDSYAVNLTGQAKRFALVHSELNSGINRILRTITWIMIPTGGLLFWREIRTAEGLDESVADAVAAMVGMIPEGLVLLTSVAFAVAVIVLGRHKVLVQELPAVEGLARADVVCFDKTGTLTESGIELERIEMLSPTDTSAGEIQTDKSRVNVEAVDESIAIAAVALASDESSRNPTMDAIAAAFPERQAHVLNRVAFSSERKWSAVTLESSPGAEPHTWLLGAPEIILRHLIGHANGQNKDKLAEIGDRVQRYSRDGKRVLLLSSSRASVEEPVLPDELEPEALILLEEKMRPDAAGVVSYLREEGVDLKVISGDNPLTVAAVARRAGIEPAGDPVDAASFTENPAELARLTTERNIFGRVTAQQKQEMIREMQSSGRVVVMAGDGVNDVLALKEAEIGIAMGAGAAGGAKAVSQFVILEARFATLPVIVAEGRRVMADVERVAFLFVTKTCYATLLAIMIGILGWPFPFLPRHLTLVGAITIGTPAFFLALAPNKSRYTPGFVRRVLRFTIPTGSALAAVTLSSYALSRAADASIEQSRTLATLVLTIMGLWVLVLLARPLTVMRIVLILSMIAGLLVVIVTPIIHQFFNFEFPPPALLIESLGIAGAAMAALTLFMHLAGWEPRGGRRWIKRSK